MESELFEAVRRFERWLDEYGETSQDHQDFFAGRLGGKAKALYYSAPRPLGHLAVAPMVLCEAFVPSARAVFHHRMRLPISDAHYAMAFVLLFKVTGDDRYYDRARHFLGVLEKTRCMRYLRHGWGYPFDWQTRNGLIRAGTPLITTTPYCYEAFDYLFRIDGDQHWREVMKSTVDHAFIDYTDHEAGPHASTCSYTPEGGEGVVNASAYRAFLLTSGWREFLEENYRAAAERNLNFVLQSQGDDGSWPYAVDGRRDFIDHFHTCFVLKALVKIEGLTGNEACTRAIERGVEFYLANLFDAARLPRPFARAPRLTIYQRELYDYAECLNLGALLRGRFPDMDRMVDRVLGDVLANWMKVDGSFRSRKLLLGWDNVPMHRWGQSMMFRSLCLLLLNSRSGMSLSRRP